jgi:hypothetical protein
MAKPKYKVGDKLKLYSIDDIYTITIVEKTEEGYHLVDDDGFIIKEEDIKGKVK